MGVLAGRYKRHWLYEGRRKSDAQNAFDLYKKAYEIAVQNKDDDQALYNGINVAFMKLVFMNNKKAAKETTFEVIRYCWNKNEEEQDKWSLATQGEINLILGRKKCALCMYKEAVKKKYNANSRELVSMYNQAMLIIEELKFNEIKEKFKRIFYGNCPE